MGSRERGGVLGWTHQEGLLREPRLCWVYSMVRIQMDGA